MDDKSKYRNITYLDPGAQFALLERIPHDARIIAHTACPLSKAGHEILDGFIGIFSSPKSRIRVKY